MESLKYHLGPNSSDVFVVKATNELTLLPNESLELDIPDYFINNNIFIEPYIDSIGFQWEYISVNNISFVNDKSYPVKISKDMHLAKIWPLSTDLPLDNSNCDQFINSVNATKKHIRI